jgi:hypothetical protein
MMSAAFQAWPHDLWNAASSIPLLKIGMQTPVDFKQTEENLQWQFHLFLPESCQTDKSNNSE